MNPNVTDIYGKLRSSLWGEQGLSVFLFLLFLSFFLAPFIDSVPVRLLTSLFFSLFMFYGVVNMSHQPAVRLVAGVVAVVAVILRWLRHFMPTPAIVGWGNFASLAFLIMITAVILLRVFRESGPVTAHKIRGAIAVYLLFGITWSTLYGLLDQILPQAFNIPGNLDIHSVERQEMMTYFSFVTLTTVGYGDITPTHEVTRMFAIMEALCGQLYPATLLARLVSLEVMNRESSQ